MHKRTRYGKGAAITYQAIIELQEAPTLGGRVTVGGSAAVSDGVGDDTAR
jgi:hypothetical protein